MRLLSNDGGLPLVHMARAAREEENHSLLMGASRPVVSVLDDEEAIAVAAARMLRAEGFIVRTHTSATAFLDAHDGAIPGCLVSDIHMPGMNGLELQQALSARGIRTPIIFVTGVGDIPMAVQAMRGGAVTFLSKPVERAELVAAVREALAHDASERARGREERTISNRLATLTPRERQVLDLLTMGLPSKQIAHMLGTVEKTIRVHRSRIIEKMKASGAVALIRQLASAGLLGKSARRTHGSQQSAAESEVDAGADTVR